MRGALALLALLVSVAAGGCCRDAYHTYVIDAPDPELQPILQACMDAGTCYMNGKNCIWPECQTACRRVVELAGDPVEGDMKSCYVTPVSADGGTGVRVSVAFDDCGLF